MSARNASTSSLRRPSATEPLAKSVCGKVGGLDPARVLGSRDRAVREASAKDSEKLFLLLSGFQNSPIFSQGRPGYSRRAGAGGWRESWRSRSLAACTIATNGVLPNRLPPRPAVPLPRERQPCRRQRLSILMTSRHRDPGTARRAKTPIFGQLFSLNASLSRFGEAHGPKWRELGYRPRMAPRIATATE